MLGCIRSHPLSGTDVLRETTMLQFLMIHASHGHKAKMDERGASAVEYGLLVAGIAAVIVGRVSSSASGDTSATLHRDTCDRHRRGQRSATDGST